MSIDLSQGLLIYFVGINTFSLLVMWFDKMRAKGHAYRVPEKRLFSLAITGGALGIGVGMRVFRHKTKHKSFTYGIPALVIVNLVVYAYVVYLVCT